MKKAIFKPTQKILAEYLNLSEGTISKYKKTPVSKIKLSLMLKGLEMLEIEKNKRNK